MHVQAPAPLENSLHDTPPNKGCRPVGDRRFKTFLCLPTAVAGQYSYIPVSHPGKFPRGLAAPMTTGRRHTIFILIRALHKTIRNSREEPAPRLDRGRESRNADDMDRCWLRGFLDSGSKPAPYWIRGPERRAGIRKDTSSPNSYPLTYCLPDSCVCTTIVAKGR